MFWCGNIAEWRFTVQQGGVLTRIVLKVVALQVTVGCKMDEA